MRPPVPHSVTARAAARLERMVRAELTARKTAQLRIRERINRLDQTASRAESAAAGLVGSWRAQVEAFSWRTRPFDGDMTVDAAWRRHPGTPTIFAQHHLPACSGCAVRFDETLAEASQAYGLSLDALLGELNDLLDPGAMVHPSTGTP